MYNVSDQYRTRVNLSPDWSMKIGFIVRKASRFLLGRKESRRKRAGVFVPFNKQHKPTASRGRTSPPSEIFSPIAVAFPPQICDVSPPKTA